MKSLSDKVFRQRAPLRSDKNGASKCAHMQELPFEGCPW